MATTSVSVNRLQPRPLPANIACIQPGGGWVVSLERGWRRLRRGWLRTFRPAYVARMKQRRQGECPQCPHDPIDASDRKLYRNVCGYSFGPAEDEVRGRSRLPIAPWGRAEVLVYGGALLGLAGFAGWLWPWAALPPALLAAFAVAFFRDPSRRIPTEPGVIVSPADGTVTDVTELEADDFLGGPAIRIGIYLSVFNVHVNRCPERARVIEVRYRPGRFRDVRHHAAKGDNEQLWTLLESEQPPHFPLVIKQIAGALARRIVCVARPGEVLERGDRIGMIKFGSRTELCLPRTPGLVLTVQPGDRVRGGSSILARYHEMGGEWWR